MPTYGFSNINLCAEMVTALGNPVVPEEHIMHTVWSAPNVSFSGL